MDAIVPLIPKVTGTLTAAVLDPVLVVPGKLKTV
jgi:hypothetical protein